MALNVGDLQLQKFTFGSGRRLALWLFLAAPALAQSVQPELFNGLKWRLIGPFRGGRAVAVAGVPGNSTTFYFGSVDGGIWKTTDGGVVWTPIFDGQPIASIGALAVAPSDPNIIYAGTGESDIRTDLSSGNGVYKSSDAGHTWVHIGLDETRQISRIVVDPRDPNTVYVGALGHAYGPNEERGVYKSVDGGVHWEKVLDRGPATGIADLAICSANPKLLFATVWNAYRPPWSAYATVDGPGSGLFRSQDAGKTWTPLTGNGLPDGDWGRAGVAVAPDGQRVYALISAKKAGLYRSDDGGTTWTLANPDPRLTGRGWYFSGITVDPHNRDVVYMPNVALYRSDDAGKTISIVRGAPGGDDYHQIWIDPKNSSSMVLGTDQGTTVSLDHGLSWSSWYNQPTAQIYHLTTDNQFPYIVYGTQQDSGSVAVLSRTDHAKIGPGDWFPAGPSESGYVAIDPADPSIIYLAGAYGSVSRFDRRTTFSQDVTPYPAPGWNPEISQHKYRDPWTPALVFSPVDPSALYLATQFVMKTVDGGLHWQTISPDLTGAAPDAANSKTPEPLTVKNAKQRGYGVVFTVAPSPLQKDLIWAGSDTGLIHLTRDGGRTWNNVSPPGLPDWSIISLIEASHFDPATAYAAVDRSVLDDQTPYLYRTHDYGASWQLVTNGIPAGSFLRAVREDPHTKGLLFAGTELGVYVSFDDGDHWMPLQLNLPVSSVRDLTIHNDDLVIATHGRSFWILDNITPLRQTSEAASAKSTWLYRPSDAVRIDNDGFTGTPLPPEEPTAENPPSGAMIDYFLKAEAKNVQLEVFDQQQNLVRRFSSEDKRSDNHTPAAIADRWFPKLQILEKTPGMHRFVWNLTWGASNPSVDEDDESRPPVGPKAVPGIYQVRLTVDGEAQSQTLRLTMDPRSPATQAVLDEQLHMGKQIFFEALVARGALSEINSVLRQLTELQQKAAGQNAKLKAELADAQSQLGKIVGGPPAPAGLQAAYSGLAAALHVVESGDRAAPSQAIAIYQDASRQSQLRMGDWAAFKQTKMPQLNQDLRDANVTPINISQIEREAESQMSQ
jgi:photosystem II stability/assembly factor-like uncharacterized protein